MFFFKKVILVTNFIIMPLANATHKVWTMANDNDYNNMFVLGDSLSDTGAFVQYQGNMYQKIVINPECLNSAHIWQPPYGDPSCHKLIKLWKPKAFSLPFFQNSFSNGPVAVQILAESLGLNNFISGSEDGTKFKNIGYNYATGTAKVLTSQELLPLEFKANIQSISLQSDRYNLSEQVKMLKRHHNAINKKDLLIINIGGNDIIEIINAWLLIDLESIATVLTARLNKVVDTLFAQVEDLVKYGFNRIVIANLPDLSKTPMFSLDLEAQKIAAEVVEKYNARFKWKYNFLMKNYILRRKLRMFDINLAFLQTLNEYHMSSKITDKPAVDINWAINLFFNDTFEPYYIAEANKDNIDDYAFFDELHPTGAFHLDISKKLLELVNRYWPYQ